MIGGDIQFGSGEREHSGGDEELVQMPPKSRPKRSAPVREVPYKWDYFYKENMFVLTSIFTIAQEYVFSSGLRWNR